jgi:hypothetical protein
VAASISNLTIEAAGDGYAGGILGSAQQSELSFEQSHVRSSIVSLAEGNIGGFAGIGIFGAASIQDSAVQDLTLISSENYIGGFIGLSGPLTLTRVQARSIDISTSALTEQIGGIVGFVDGLVDVVDAVVFDLDVPTMGSGFGGLVGITTGGFMATGVTISSISAVASDGQLGGLVGFAQQEFTVSDVVLEDVSLLGQGDYIGGHAGSLGSSYEASNVSSQGVSLESTNDGGVGGLVGASNGAFSVSDVTLSESMVRGNGHNVSSVVGLTSGDFTVKNLTSYISVLSNSGTGTGTGGLAGSIQGMVIVENIAIQDARIEAGGDAVSFGIAGVSGDVTASEVMISYSIIDSAETLAHVGAFIGVSNGNIEMELFTISNVQFNLDLWASGGIVGSSNGDVSASYIAVTDLSLESTTGQDYIGGFFGSVQGTVTLRYSEAGGIVVQSFNGGDYIGGVIGGGANVSLTEVSLTDITVIGDEDIGGVAGSVISNFTTSAVMLANFQVEGRVKVGGVFGAGGRTLLSGINATNLAVSGSEDAVGGLIGIVYAALAVNGVAISSISAVAGGDYIGGLAGQTTNEVLISSLTIQGIEVVGLTALGGVIGAASNNMTMSLVLLQDLRILSQGVADSDESYIGGLVGFSGGGMLSVDIITLANSTIETRADFVGGFAGANSYGVSISNYTLDNVSISGATYVGGIVGQSTGFIDLDAGFIAGLTASASIGYVGGIAGFIANAETQISELWLEAITIESAGDSAGGMIGQSVTGTILRDIEMRDVSVDSLDQYSGGIVGWSSEAVTISRAVIQNIEVTGASKVGGLVGWTNEGTDFSQMLILDLAVTGSSEVGELVGEVAGNDSVIVISQSYVVRDFSSVEPFGNVFGSTGSAVLPTEISRSSVSEVATYLGWDFSNDFGLECSIEPVMPGIKRLNSDLLSTCYLAPAPSNPVQSTPSAPYSGPEFSKVEPRSGAVGDVIVLTGRALDQISKITIDGKTVLFTVLSSTKIEIKVTAEMSLGFKDLVIDYAGGKLLASRAFEVIQKPVIVQPIANITSFNGRVWIYFKNVVGKNLVVKIGSKWHRVPNNGAEVVRFSRKIVKGKSVSASAFVAGIRLITKSVVVR